MKLESMRLENIRSHVKTVISFTKGFNCLVGGLGQGKSTVLYAFDFVLFGDPLGRSYDYLLREGTEEGKVTAVFDQDSRTYKLQRALRRRGKGISQDIDQLRFYQDGKLIASTKNDAVAEELKALTGLDKNLFREVVWVRQEHLKELLDMTPRQRQKKLDQLFGLSDYEAAWSGLHLFEKSYEVEKDVLERDADVIRVGKIEADYIGAVEEFSSVAGQLKDLEKKLGDAESTLKETTARLEGLEELRRETEVLQRREIQIQTNITNIKDRSRELAGQAETNKKRLDELEELLKQMETQEKSHRNELQEIGLGTEKTLEDLQTYLSVVDEKLRDIGGEQEATKREIGASLTRISSLITENKCPTCLQDLAGDYKKSLLENLQEEKAEREKKLVELQKNLDKLNGLHSKVNFAFSNLQQLIPRIQDMKNQVTEKNETLRNLSAEVEGAEEQEKRLQKQLGETREEIANFDVAELESARKLRDDAFTTYSYAKHELESLEGRKGDLALRVDELKERLDNAQEKIERKERIDRLLGIIARIRGAYRSIQPKLRSEFVTYLQRTVQQVLDSLVGDVGPALFVTVDETYSPLVSSEMGYEREVSNLSGGERTLLAFAYRIGLGQLIMQSRTGHGLYMLLLDEPTESLGREDGSVERLAEAVSRLKAIEQIIAVTHNEAFAEKAEHVIRVEKEAGESQVFMEK
ncbi:MAG: SMC family ATPase [Candidatus Bathyarchaeum sp.]|nr:MAG: SMC family ATPase [Candidatus Bathyarchaeum sp.]